MYRIAVLGDYDSIYGFATLGLDTFPVTEPVEATKKLHQLAGGEYAVIYVTESPVSYTHLTLPTTPYV